MPVVDDRPVLLVLRALNLGDLLVAVPALRALRRSHPDHRLVLAAPEELGGVALRTGAVDQVIHAPIPAALRWGRAVVDVAVNLHGLTPTALGVLAATYPRNRIGFASPGWPGPEWDDSDDVHERVRWCALIEAYGIPADPDDMFLDAPAREPGTGPVLVHPGARSAAKRWPVERYAEVVAALHRAGHEVLVTGTADERPLALEVGRAAGLSLVRVIAGRTTPDELFDLVARAALVIGGDTGTAHLASALRVPSVVLVGPLPASRWGPPAGGPHVVLGDDGPRRGDPDALDPDPALLAVSVPDVLTAADGLLGRG